MEDTRPPLLVVAGVIVRKRKVLIARRGPGGAHGGLWEFPGGKVEEGEDEKTALRRELLEELGIEVRVRSRAVDTVYAYPHRTIRLVSYWCRIVSGEPRPIECAEIAWAHPAEMKNYQMPEADDPLRELLMGMDNRTGENLE